MKILTIDDNPIHLEAAREQFAGHELVCHSAYAPVRELLDKPGKHGFDLVLTDLLMPAERQTLGSTGMKYFGHPLGIGHVLALAAAQAEVPLVICITDANHHDHPASAALDWIGGRTACLHSAPRVFTVDQSRVLIGHAKLDTQGRKDWRAALDILEGRRTCWYCEVPAAT